MAVIEIYFVTTMASGHGWLLSSALPGGRGGGGGGGACLTLLQQAQVEPVFINEY